MYLLVGRKISKFGHRGVEDSLGEVGQSRTVQGLLSAATQASDSAFEANGQRVYPRDAQGKFLTAAEALSWTIPFNPIELE